MSTALKPWHPAFLIATCFGIGKAAFAPGTFGSLVAYPLFIAPAFFLPTPQDDYSFMVYIGLYLIATLLLFALGTIAAHIYARKTMNPDPKEVVIDEVVGQLLTLICTLPFIEKIYLADKSWVESTSPYLLIAIFYPLPFILFRYFDICKPWPINWCDRNIKGGFGIMFDDIVAAFAAIIMFHTIGMILGDYF